MSYVLRVTCSTRDFYAYWYGVGELVSVEPFDGEADSWKLDRSVFTVDYGSDGYRAEYQQGRFLSGLIGATVSQEVNPGWVDVPGGGWVEP